MLFVPKMPENWLYVTKLATSLKMAEIWKYPNNYHGLQPCKVGLISGRSTNQHVISEVPVKAARACLGAPPCLVHHLQYKMMCTNSHGIPWPKQAATQNASKFRLRFTHEKLSNLDENGSNLAYVSLTWPWIVTIQTWWSFNIGQ